MTQGFDYAAFRSRRHIRTVALKAARQVDPLIRKAMEEAAEQGRAISRVMAEGRETAGK